MKFYFYIIKLRRNQVNGIVQGEYIEEKPIIAEPLEASNSIANVAYYNS